jgi:hypothetical protein
MSHNLFEFMRQYIHFCNNNKRKPKGHPGYDPQFKITWILNAILNGIQKVWVVAKHLAIDESMIKYVGRAINVVQYMKNKPIKHRIKVFACCCAYSGVLLWFFVYCGKENMLDKDATTVSICDKLVKMAHLTAHQGRVLVTDNYHTTVKLAKHMFEQYGWTIVGTIVPTDKVTRADKDFPFLELLQGAKNEVKRGWYCEAVMECMTTFNIIYYLQATTWREKKQVCFLSSNKVGASYGMMVHRREKGNIQVLKLQHHKHSRTM